MEPVADVSGPTAKAAEGDLNYLQNLNALGPVWVPPKTTLLRSVRLPSMTTCIARTQLT